MTTFAKVVKDVERWCGQRLIDATVHGQFEQMREEITELDRVLEKPGSTHEEIRLEAGDIGAVWIAICFKTGVDPHRALEAAYEKIKDRDGEVRGGRFVKEEDL